MDETSMMLAVRPDLVNPDYKNAKPFAGDKIEDLIGIARSKDWHGYFGSPRLASRQMYANGWEMALKEATTLAMKILNGLDERIIPRFGDEMKKSLPDVALDNASLKHETAIRQKQERWLKKNRLR